MKTKQEIQLELLQEIDGICSENNLKYIFIGMSALNAYIIHSIKQYDGIVSVAMTQGDIDRFCEIVENQSNNSRYVEGIFNNPNFLELYVNYGNKNTAEIDMLARNKNKHHGINVRIYPILKTVQLDGTRIITYTPRLSKEREMRKFMSKTFENKKFWFGKAGIDILNGAYSLTGGGKRYYKELKAHTFIDKWEDIQKFSRVSIIKNEFDSKLFKEIDKIEFDGIKLSVLKDIESYFSALYGEKFKEIKIIPKRQKMREIVDTEVGYEEIIEEIGDLIKEAKATREEVMWGRLKVYREKIAVDNVWNLVKMTNSEIEFSKFFEKNIDRLLNFNIDDEEELEELYEELSPIIETLQDYSRIGMTFSINPKADDLINRVLIKKGQKSLVDKMEKISKKKYFVK